MTETLRIRHGRLVSPNSIFALLTMIGLIACGRSPERKQAAFLESGNKYLEQKQYGPAILQFRNAVKVAPKNPEAHYRLGLAFLAVGDVQQGVKALVRATELNPKHVGAQLKLAEMLASSPEKPLLEESQKRLREALSASPNNSDALTALAFTESRLGELAYAEKHLRQALQESPASLKASLVLARVKLAQRDPAGAEQVLKSVVNKTPQSVDARLAMAELYILVSKPADAEKELRKAVDLDPNSARAMLGLAALYLASGRKEDAEKSYRQVASLPGQRYRHLYAAYLFNDGRRAAAIQELERLVRESPRDRDLRTRLVVAYLVGNRTLDAEKVLASALQVNPKDTDALLLRSEVLLGAGRYADAQKDLSEVLRFKPESAEAHFLVAKVHRGRGHASLERQELAEALQRKPDLLDARVELARNLIDSKSAQQALEVLDQAPAFQKNSVARIVARNHALLSLGKIAEFTKGVSGGLALARVPDLLAQDAQLKTIAKDYAGALASVEEALKQNPEHLGALEAMFRIYATRDGIPAGLEKLRGYARRVPHSARVQQYAGERMIAGGRREEARQSFRAAKAADPALVEIDLSLAQIDLLDGRLDTARGKLMQIISADADRLAARLLLASTETKAGNHEAAIAQYRRILEADPNHVLALNNVAYLLAEFANQPQEALKYAQKAKELAPDNADVEGTIGWVYYRKGLYSSALEHLKDAVAKDGAAAHENAAVRKYHLAMAYSKAGDRERSRQVLKQALALNPKLPEAQLAKTALSETP